MRQKKTLKITWLRLGLSVCLESQNVLTISYEIGGVGYSYLHLSLHSYSYAKL